MKTELERWLSSCETDIEGAIKRFGNNESLYVMYLKNFLEEPTMSQLSEAVKNKDWESAFTFVHSLKGLAGNLGFVPLYSASAELVLLLRDKKIEDVEMSYQEVKNSYDKVIIAITQGLESIQ